MGNTNAQKKGPTTAIVLCASSLLLLILLPLIYVMAQKQIAKSDVTEVKDLLVKNPADNKTTAGGVVVKLPRSKRYRIVAFFEGKPNGPDLTFRRMKLYKPASNQTDCSHVECWIPLAQRSVTDADTSFTLEHQNFDSVLVTAWASLGGMNRAGTSIHSDDMVKGVEEIIENGLHGIKIQFGTQPKRVFVTILPL
jgi:hypothetical protein